MPPSGTVIGFANDRSRQTVGLPMTPASLTFGNMNQTHALCAAPEKRSVTRKSNQPIIFSPFRF